MRFTRPPYDEWPAEIVKTKPSFDPQLRRELLISIEAALVEVEQRFVVLPINSKISLRALFLPVNYPKDPADRIIGATALVERLTLVTADAKIRNSRAVPTIW
jgi:PIN domain nuclease of toxin-antitoxin system